MVLLATVDWPVIYFGAADPGAVYFHNHRSRVLLRIRWGISRISYIRFGVGAQIQCDGLFHDALYESTLAGVEAIAHSFLISRLGLLKLDGADLANISFGCRQKN